MSQKHTDTQNNTRFGFGENWKRFLSHLTEDQIEQSAQSFKKVFKIENLQQKTFLDVGSGSGLSSLTAMHLQAKKVHSFDYDPQSVACTKALKERYYPEAQNWTIERGDILDTTYLKPLEQWDVVYSWGVLHHTGNMWQAFENIATLVKPNGWLFVAIYNDQGTMSKIWTTIKKAYNKLPPALRFLVLYPSFLYLWGPIFIYDLLRGKPFEKWRTYGKERGMHPWDDVVDWVGGYPFEVAKPEEIFEFFQEKGFSLVSLKTVSGKIGNNELVFRKTITG